MVLDRAFQCVDAGFEGFLVLDDMVQFGWDGVDQEADAGDAAAGEQKHETGDGFLLDAPPKTRC